MSILAPNRKPISRYQPRGRAAEPPLPPSWRPPAMWEKHHPDVALWRFVFLSILLHTLFITLFGAPTGASREGRGLWGSFDVVIHDSFREPAPALRFDRTLAAPRIAPRATPASPPQPAPRPAPKVETVAPSPVAPPSEPPAQAVPPVIDRLEPAQEAPAFEVPRPVDTIPVPRIERQMAEPPKIEAPPMPPPKPIDVPRIEAPVLPRIERTLAEPPKIEAPPAPPIEVPRIEAPVMPRIERSLAEPPKVEAPPMPPPRPVEVPRLEAPAVPRIERQLSEPPKIEAPKLEAPKVEAPQIEAPKAQAPVAPAAPAQRIDAPTSKGAPDAQREAPKATPQAPAIERSLAPAEPPSAFRAAPAPRTNDYDPTAPSLDLDAMRKRAADLTRAGTGNRAVLPFPMPPVEKPKNKLEDAIDKARKPDCAHAYAGLGLLAVVPLVANEFGEGTCRWRP